MHEFPDFPEAFMTTLLVEKDKNCGLTVLHVGFERGNLRNKAFATHILDWLPEFALTYKEFSSLGHHNSGELMRKAARKVFQTDHYKKRGEFGEIILHAAVRQVYGSVPAISKMFFKDGPNETVKGFDIVHLVGDSDNLELWLGEAKFYEDCKGGLAAAAESLKEHFNDDYLRQECTFILDKGDDQHPHYETLKKILSERTSLDHIIKRIVVPVLVTYDSPVLATHTIDTDQLSSLLVDEGRAFREWWLTTHPLDLEVKIVLILLPLKTKKLLNEQLNAKLKSRQED